VLVPVRIIIHAAFIVTAINAGAQTNAPATAAKPLEAIGKNARPAETAVKSKQDPFESKSDKQKGAPSENNSAATSGGASSAGDKKSEAPEGLQLAPGRRRDPFRPITLNVRSNTRRRENLSPLELVEIGQLNLVGIVWGIKEPLAVIVDSAGVTYMVTVGTPIGSNDGTVKAIHRNQIVVEEFTDDIYGVRKKIDRSLNLATE
jgi:type IV pilus assembly protein PilP